MPRVLIAEDDPGVRDVLRDLFEAERYDVHDAHDGRSAIQAVEQFAFDVVTLDLSLDSDDGLAVMRAIRLKSDVAIIIISAKSSDVDRIIGLEVGADDYIVKPFNTREVLARVRAVLRRADPARAVDDTAPKQKFRFGDLLFDGHAHQLIGADGNIVDLTSRELQLLSIFVRRPARVLTRETLLTLLGDSAHASLDRAIDSVIARLRKKLEAGGADRRFIETVRGLGYRFTARVSVED